MSFSKDGGIGRNASHNQKKDNNKFKNKKQPELPEHQTAWNSDNQGGKETFIQTSRKCGDGQPGGEDVWQGGRLCCGEEAGGLGSATFTQISREEQLGSETDLEAQGFSMGN